MKNMQQKIVKQKCPAAMTLTSRTCAPFTPTNNNKNNNNSSSGNKFSRWRRAIIAVVAVISILITTLMVGHVMAVLMKYKNNNSKSNENFQNASNATDDSQLVSGVEIMLLTNEFAAKINANHNNNKQMYNNKSIGSLNSASEKQFYETNAAVEYYGNKITTTHNNKNNNNNNSNSNLLPIAAELHRNRFDDAINISNQGNELDERPKAAKAAIATKTVAAATAMAEATLKRTTATAALSPTAAINCDSAPLTSLVAAKSPGSNGLADEASRPIQLQQQPQQRGRSQPKQENTELAHHRQKRYLLFPEGSSFQMVFDLIIGMVDYTSYLILGITCAVAWELPSKPPSELIESLHEKITEGIYPTSETKPTATTPVAMRRNDSNVVINGSDSKYGMDIKYVDNAYMPDYAGIKYGNQLQTQVATALPQPLPPPNAMETAYQSTLTHRPNPFASPIAGYTESAGTNYAAYRPTNYYTNTQSNKNKYYKPANKYNFADKNEKSNYYGVGGSSSSGSKSNNQKPLGYSALGDSTDKQAVKFANRWHPSQYKKWQSWQDYDSNWQPYQQQQEQKHAKWAQQQQKWSTQAKYAGMDNWWLRNKQHAWRTKQGDWRADNVRIPVVPTETRHPVLAYASPIESAPQRPLATITSKADAVEGRSAENTKRTLLATRPKAKIYPVFGRRRRRRRRRSSDAKLDAFELKLERVHLREQLRTRQKLYGKIEKLYETRGQNGTACVLRALCETGQQQKMKTWQDDKAEPQSFITELLRAIFVLPTASSTSITGGSVEYAAEHALHHTDWHLVDEPYREAQAHRGNCAQLFAACEHSIWE